MDDRKKTILLVEDSPEDAFFFRRSLKKSGVVAELILAGDGKEAVSLLSRPEFRADLFLVFLDLKLPRLNGFDVLRWLQSENFSPPLPVVVLSGSAHKSDQMMAHELGAADYLVKPITAEMIREHMEAVHQSAMTLQKDCDGKQFCNDQD